MGEAIALGLAAMARRVSEAATKLVTDARTDAGAAAGEGSPAKKWIPLGINSALGFIIGLLSKLQDAGRAGARLATVAAGALSGANLNLMPALAGGINLPAATSVAGYASAVPGVSSSSTTSRVVHQNIGAQYNYDTGPADDLAEQSRNSMLFSGK